MTDTNPLTAGIIIFENVEELDFVGPWEVLSMAKVMGLGIEPFLIAETDAPVTCAKGMQVLPDQSFAQTAQLDIVLVPGGQGTRTEVSNQKILEFIAAQAECCTWLTSVCTGAALLGAAGAIAGKKLTTHWNAFDFVAEHAPNCTLIKDQRVVQDGNYLSSAGVSAGIDMALTLIGLIKGQEAARNVQKYMEYYPEPPYGGAHPNLAAKTP